jgi:DNA polymerase-3 subunit alpha
VVTVKGRLDRRDDTRIGFMVQDIQVVEGLESGAALPLRLRVPASSLNEIKIHQIKKVLREHPGESPVYLHIGAGKVLRLADEFCVDLDRVVGELRMVLGHDAVVL